MFWMIMKQKVYFENLIYQQQTKQTGIEQKRLNLNICSYC